MTSPTSFGDNLLDKTTSTALREGGVRILARPVMETEASSQDRFATVERKNNGDLLQ